VNPTGVMMVTAQVRHFDAAVEWYLDVLGLSILWIEPGEFCTRAPAGSSGPAIALATDHPDRISSSPGVGWTPILVVHDFDSAVTELKTRGVTFDAEEEGSEEGYRLVRIRDPEGNPIGITAAQWV